MIISYISEKLRANLVLFEMNLLVLLIFVLTISSTVLSYPYYLNQLDQHEYQSLGEFMPESTANVPYRSNWLADVLFNNGTKIRKDHRRYFQKQHISF